MGRDGYGYCSQACLDADMTRWKVQMWSPGAVLPAPAAKYSHPSDDARLVRSRGGPAGALEPLLGDDLPAGDLRRPGPQRGEVLDRPRLEEPVGRR